MCDPIEDSGSPTDPIYAGVYVFTSVKLKNGGLRKSGFPRGDLLQDLIRSLFWISFRVDFGAPRGASWGSGGCCFFAFVLFSLLFLMLSCLGFVFVCLFVFWFCFYALVSVAMVDFC